MTIFSGLPFPPLVSEVIHSIQKASIRFLPSAGYIVENIHMHWWDLNSGVTRVQEGKKKRIEEFISLNSDDMVLWHEECVCGFFHGSSGSHLI